MSDVDLPADLVHLEVLDEERRQAGVAVQHEVVAATKHDRVEHDATLRSRFHGKSLIIEGKFKALHSPYFNMVVVAYGRQKSRALWFTLLTVRLYAVKKPRFAVNGQ